MPEPTEPQPYQTPEFRAWLADVVHQNTQRQEDAVTDQPQQETRQWRPVEPRRRRVSPGPVLLTIAVVAALLVLVLAT